MKCFAIVCIVAFLFLEQIKAWNRIIRRGLPISTKLLLEEDTQKCNVGNGAGYKTTEKKCVSCFYLDLLPSWIKGCVQKMFGKTLYFSYFYFVYGNVLHRLIMKN